MFFYFPGFQKLELVVNSGDCETNDCEEQGKELTVVDFLFQLGVSLYSFTL